MLPIFIDESNASINKRVLKRRVSNELTNSLLETDNLDFNSRNDSTAEKTLLQSSATLIIVPDSLVDHWQFQIDSYVAAGVKCNLFVDHASDCGRPLPPAEYLAKMHIIVITQR